LDELSVEQILGLVNETATTGERLLLRMSLSIAHAQLCHFLFLLGRSSNRKMRERSKPNTRLYYFCGRASYQFNQQASGWVFLDSQSQ
jgi:hypothetical protein